MKKAVFFVTFFLTLLLLCSCEPKEQNNMQTSNNKTITVINEVNEADVWILSDTKENKKTTLWGKATVSKIKTGESRKAMLCEPGDDGLYILRMIDTDSFYYSADGITLEPDWTITIKEDEYHSVSAEVTDNNNTVINTYEVFSAKL